MAKSLVAIPFSTDSVELAVKDATAVPTDARGQIIVGLDGSTTRFVNVDSSGRVFISSPQLPATLVGGRLDTNLGAWLGSTVPTVGQKIMASSIPVVFSSDQSSLAVTVASLPLPSGAATEASLVKLNVPLGTALGSNTQALVGASVTTAAPTYTTGQISPLSLTVAGGLRVDGSGVTQPVSAASLPLPSGAATETTLAAINTKTLAAGQAVMASSSPVVIASNQTSIPVTDNGGSLTVDGTVTANIGTTNGLALDATLTGGTARTRVTDGTTNVAVKAASTAAVAADPALVVAVSPNNSVAITAASLPLPSGAATETTLAAINTKTLAAGQAVMASSSPVVIASNQTAIPITDNAGSLTVDGTVTANQGTAAALAGRWPVIVTDGTNTMPTGDAVGRAVFEKITDGTNTAAVKAASTAPVAADPALVIAVSPNSLPLSTQLSGFRYSSTIPDPSNYATTNQTPTAFDKQGRLEVHATITGDKGAFREEFTGTALANAMSGTLTFTNGLATVTGSGTGFTGLAKGQWVKKTADAEAQYGQIFSVGNDTTLTLTAPYTGTTGASTGVISNWQTVTATGGSIVVATSLATLASGVTSGQSTYLRRDVGSGPYTFQHIFSISQRIANQTIFAGPADNPTTPGLRARVEFTGTNNTQCTLVTSAGLLAGDVQSTTVSLPNSGTTATAHNYRIEQSGSRVSLVVDNIRLVTHDTHLPDPYAMLQWHIGITNTGVPASSTNVVVDVCYSASYERTQIDNDFSGEALSIQGPDATGLVTSSNPVLGGGIDQNGLLRTVALDANGVTRVVTPARQRVSITFQAVAPAVADTLLTLVKSTNGTAAAGATTQPVAASKILRLTSMTFSLRAGAAAAAFATFNLRINAAGAAVIGSPSEFRVDLGNTEAVIGAARSITIPLVNGFELSGTQQLAVSAAAQAVTNILSVTLSGYEYAI